MQAKKKLIGRLAVAAGVVLGLALVVLAGTTLAWRSERQGREERARRQREALVERSRKYAGELAQRVQGLPVDPALVGEIESRYFEEYASGPMQVWAMGTDGRFLFGVPREAFDKLNAIYDRDVEPNLKEGVFVDRQTFLRTLADASEEIGPRSFAPEPSEDGDAAWERWRRFGHDSGRAFVVSAPLRDASGAALGSLYLKRVAAERGALERQRAARRAGGGRRRRRARGRLPVAAAADLGVRRRARPRAAPRVAVRLPDGDLGPRRPGGLPDRAPRGPGRARLPRLQPRGGRQRLVPALRPGPVGRVLLRLPLPVEARLGLLPGLPHRDPLAGPAPAPAPEPIA